MGLGHVTVTEIREETDNIKVFRLGRVDGRPFDEYAAGAHIDVVGPTGVMRQYSLCSPPYEPDSYAVAIKRAEDSRGGSAAMHSLAVGTTLEIGPPRNLLGVAADADRHVLVAGGIGVTPMLSIAYHLHRVGESFELHYFARSRDEAAFAELLEHRAPFADSVQLHFGVGREGHPEILQTVVSDLSPDSHVYICGPEGFMDQVSRMLAPVVGADHIHIEHFEAGDARDSTDDSPFSVALDTGAEFEVPAGKSIVEVLRENGVDIGTSCQEGICGTCVSGVLEGTPDHRDLCLSTSEKEANDQMAPCVSRSKTPRLVIELY